MIPAAMSSLWRRLGLVLLLCGISPLARAQDHAQTGDPPTLAVRPLGVDLSRTPSLTPEQLEYAKAIGRELVCLCGTCPRRNMTDCDCGWAETNRKIIQLAVQSGKDGPSILKAYESVYDLKVRPAPPDEGFGKASYILPYLAAVAGLLGVFAFGLKMRGNKQAVRAAVSTPANSAAPISSEAEQALKRELEDLE